MPEHSSWLTLILSHFRETLEHNASILGDTVIGGHSPTWQSFEALAASLFVLVVILLIATRVNSRLNQTDEAIIPEDKLTLRTFMEAFLAYFYDLAKSVMDAERAKKYFPLIGTAAMFDLRLLGVSRGISVSALAGHLLPWARAGLGLAAPTGVLLFITDAATIATNPAFQLKLVLIVVAVLNTVVFHRWTARSMAAGAAYDAAFLQELLTLNKGLAGDGSYGVLFDENQIFLAHADQPELVFSSVAPLAPNIFSELVSQGRLPASPNAMPSMGFDELEDRLDNAAREPVFSIFDELAGDQEQVATARETEVAERSKRIELIEAAKEAERQAISVKVQAEAEKEAASNRAAALRLEAEGESEAEKLRAEAARIRFEVEAAGQRAINEAANLLSSDQISLQTKMALLKVLPEVVREAAKPMEAIDSIKIIQVDGINQTGGQAAAGGANGDGGNLASNAVSAALAYRAQAPVIDSLMKELGFDGGSLDALVKGAAATETAAASAIPAPPRGRKPRPAMPAETEDSEDDA